MDCSSFQAFATVNCEAFSEGCSSPSGSVPCKLQLSCMGTIQSEYPMN